MCLPAKVYLVVAIFTAIITLVQNISLASVFIQFVLAIVWTYILNWLCKKGFETVSWVIVLMPLIIYFMTVFLIATSAGAAAVKHSEKRHRRHEQQQMQQMQQHGGY